MQTYAAELIKLLLLLLLLLSFPPSQCLDRHLKCRRLIKGKPPRARDRQRAMYTAARRQGTGKAGCRTVYNSYIQCKCIIC